MLLRVRRARVELVELVVIIFLASLADSTLVFSSVGCELVCQLYELVYWRGLFRILSLN